MFAFGGRHLPIEAKSIQVPKMERSPEVELDEFAFVDIINPRALIYLGKLPDAASYDHAGELVFI